jgi:hypothetical protein
MENWAGGIHRRRRESYKTLGRDYLCDRSCLPPRDTATIDATRHDHARDHLLYMI